MKILFAAIVLSLSVQGVFGKQAETKADHLKCEYLTDPIAIVSQHPILSWQLVSAQNGKRQKAYRVIVAGTPNLLAQNKGDYWDSGIVHSANSTQVIYQGKTLTSRKKVYWKVMVWDEKISRWVGVCLHHGPWV